MTQTVRLRLPLTRAVPRPVWPRGIWSRTLADYDAGALHALLSAAYEGGPEAPAPFGPWRRALWEDEAFDRSLCFLALDGRRRIVGAAQCWTTGFVKDLVVDPARRREGLATALMRTAFREFRRRGHAYVDVKTPSENDAALALYRSLGMREVAEDA